MTLSTSYDLRDPPIVAVSVVLPAFNEQLILSSTVSDITAHLRASAISFEILIVENGSTDGTLKLAAVLSATYPEVRHLRLKEGNYGEALLQGIVSAQGSSIVTFDVDLYDFVFFDRALSLIESDETDLVIASKRVAGASDLRPLPRRILTFGFAILIKQLIDLPVADAHGMKVIRRRSVIDLLPKCVMRGGLFDVELVIRASQMGVRITEIPVTVRELRPARTGVARRTVEAITGAVQLRNILRREAAHSPK